MKKKVSIFIGECHACKIPTVIYTLLGSCVAVCLYDPARRIGGMNHILLPGKADMKHFDVRARYGINAMELLINKMMNLKADRRRLVAKIFGGAHVIPAIPLKDGVGIKNAEFILDFCKTEGIKVVGQSIGGKVARKIFFHTDSGDVFLKRVAGQISADIIRQEEQGWHRIAGEIKKPGDISLFS